MTSRFRFALILATVATAGLLLGVHQDVAHTDQWTRLWTSSTYQLAAPRPTLITDLLDPTVVTRTPGSSLTDQEHSSFAEIDLSIPSIVTVHQTFNVTLQCRPDIIGQHACAEQYMVHFRGPIAFSVPAASTIYHHDRGTGTTFVECQLPQSGVYEVWAWADWHGRNTCPPAKEAYTFGAVRGSGETSFTVLNGEGSRPQVDNMRQCTRDDYSSDIAGRWVSVKHIREKYRKLPLLKSHMERSARIHVNTSMPDYVYLPYNCKRFALDYKSTVRATKDLRHVVFLGDSILRSTYCGHLYYTLHNGTIGGDCQFSSDWKSYQKSDKTFEVKIDDEERQSVRFTQRFIDDHPELAGPRIEDTKQYGTSVSHVITNLGMWFGYKNENDYVAAVYQHLERLYTHFGNSPRYTWINTYSVSAPVICFGMMRRAVLRHHGEWAAIAINAWIDRHPDVLINIIHSHQIVDSRPETASDGRHWVAEGGEPSPSVRPLVGAADDAVMEAVYDYWRLADEFDRLV